MKNLFNKNILDKANDWVLTNKNIILATVIKTWGSSPCPIGSKMIINEKGDFSGSVSGGCVETAVIIEAMSLIKENKSFRKIEFKISDKNAWDVGLACGGEIAVFIEKIN